MNSQETPIKSSHPYRIGLRYLVHPTTFTPPMGTLTKLIDRKQKKL